MESFPPDFELGIGWDIGRGWVTDASVDRVSGEAPSTRLLAHGLTRGIEEIEVTHLIRAGTGDFELQVARIRDWDAKPKAVFL